jgi:hypothetical protein
MVSETIEKTVIRIEADVKEALERIDKVKSEIGGIDDETAKTTAGTRKSSALMAASWAQVTAAVVATSAAIAAIGSKTILAAADAEEIRNKYEAVFKDMSVRSEQWAESFSLTVGRSTIETLQYLSTFQDTFVPLGFDRAGAAILSQQLTELAVDMASFNNENDTDAIASLQSALVGNHETMRRYGVIITQTTLDQELMNMGISKGVHGASEQEKVMARLNIIMNSTADAQGDAARTASSFANQTRALKGNIADMMAEAGNGAMQELSDTMVDFNEWGTSGGYDDITTFLSDISYVAADAAKAVAWLTKSFGGLYGTVAPGGLRANMDPSEIMGTTSTGYGIIDMMALSDNQLSDVLVQLGYQEDDVASKVKYRNKLLSDGKDMIDKQIDAVNALSSASSSVKFPGWAGQSDYIRARLGETGGRNIDDLLSIGGVPSNIGNQSIGSLMQAPVSASANAPLVSLVDINRNGFNSLGSKLDVVAGKIDGVIGAVGSISRGVGGGFSSGVSGDAVRTLAKTNAAMKGGAFDFSATRFL